MRKMEIINAKENVKKVFEMSGITKIIPIIKLIGAKIVAITGNENSSLAKNSDFALFYKV